MQSSSWEANWFAASQEIPRILRNPKVHYHTHKRPPPVSILGQPNPVHIPTSYLLEIHPNIIHPSTPRYPQWSLSLRLPHQDPIHPLSSPIRATCPAHLILLDFITLRDRINYETPETREAAGRSAISVRPKGHPVSTVKYAQNPRKTAHLNGPYNYERDYEVTQTGKVKGNPSITNRNSLRWDCQTDWCLIIQFQPHREHTVYITNTTHQHSHETDRVYCQVHKKYITQCVRYMQCCWTFRHVVHIIATVLSTDKYIVKYHSHITHTL